MKKIFFIFFIICFSSSLIQSKSDKKSDNNELNKKNYFDQFFNEIIPIAQLSLKEFGDMLKQNDYKSFVIKKAWYGVDGSKKNSISVKKQLQKYAENGWFPDPDTQIEYRQASHQFSNKQKELLQNGDTSPMSLFFQNNPQPGVKKQLYFTFQLNDNIYACSMPEYKEDRGLYSLPPSKKRLLENAQKLLTTDQKRVSISPTTTPVVLPAPTPPPTPSIPITTPISASVVPVTPAPTSQPITTPAIPSTPTSVSISHSAKAAIKKLTQLLTLDEKQLTKTQQLLTNPNLSNKQKTNLNNKESSYTKQIAFLKEQIASYSNTTPPIK